MPNLLIRWGKNRVGQIQDLSTTDRSQGIFHRRYDDVGRVRREWNFDYFLSWGELRLLFSQFELQTPEWTVTPPGEPALKVSFTRFGFTPEGGGARVQLQLVELLSTDT